MCFAPAASAHARCRASLYARRSSHPAPIRPRDESRRALPEAIEGQAATSVRSARPPWACCASIAPVRCLMPRALANSGMHQAAATNRLFSRAYHSAAATLCGSFRNRARRRWCRHRPGQHRVPRAVLLHHGLAHGAWCRGPRSVRARTPCDPTALAEWTGYRQQPDPRLNWSSFVQPESAHHSEGIRRARLLPHLATWRSTM